MTRKFTCACLLALVLAVVTSGASEAARRSNSSDNFGDIFNMDTAPSGFNSKAWADDLKPRTVTLWVDAQFLEKLVLNARARIDVTWLPRSLLNRLNKDSDVQEWIARGLRAYYSHDSKTKSKLKGCDIIALNLEVKKQWSFNPTELQIGDYQVTPEDFIWAPNWTALADLPAGTFGVLYVTVPSLKPKTTVKITLGQDSVDFAVPKNK